VNKWKDIKEAIYAFIPDMTVANGYNYDWVEYRRIDTYQPETLIGKAALSLEYPVDRPFEADVSEDFRPQLNTRSKMRDIDFMCRVISDTDGTIEVDDVVDQDNDALDKALWDIQKAINTGTLNACGFGIRAADYIDAEKEEIESGGVFFPYLLKVNYNIVYTETRETV
jgi:hypothetical protein